jgi:signal transduction histidine kinase
MLKLSNTLKEYCTFIRLKFEFICKDDSQSQEKEGGMILKAVTLALLIGSISAVHVLYHGSDQGFHLLHQQLFFIPLILSSFWFGLRTGCVLAAVISLLYGLPMVFREHEASGHLIIFTQSGLYFLVALLIGWLSDRERKQQIMLFKNERATALGKAASAVSLEVQNIVRRIEEIQQQASVSESGSTKDDMISEIDRLKRFLEALAKFSTPVGNLGDFPLPPDLNELLRQRLPEYNKNAAAKGVKVVVDLQEGGCPSMVIAESIPRVIDSLVDNAIDFSEKGQSIVLRSRRKADFCIFEVSDSGPGVSKENEAKLFSVFFTTKTDGYGLSLSSGKKALLDIGGDLLYEPNENGGAIFKMKIPRENPEK